jgi:ferredoxin
LANAVASQQAAVAELIKIQRVSFSEEIPNFKLQKQAAQGSAVALTVFGLWWLLLAYRRERIWVDDELCNNCMACYTNEPAIFQLAPFNKVRLNEKSWQKAINDDNYHDRAEEQVEVCQQDALSLTRFVPRRIKKQDDEK